MIRLEHANITVPDIDAAISFLQLVDPDFRVWNDAGVGHDRWVHIGCGDTYLALQAPNATGPTGAELVAYRDRGVNHLGLAIKDVDAAAARLQAAGYHESYREERHPARIRRYFSDSAGLEWELVEYLTEDRAARFQYEVA